jgi:hypothetical protein
MELSEILGGEPAPVEPTAPVETPAQVEPVEAPATTAVQAEKPRDEQGRFIPKAEPVEERPHNVPVSALIEERRKRQELEARLAAFEKPKAPELTDADYYESPSKATKTEVSAVKEELLQEVRSIRYELAEELTRNFHNDYDAVFDQFGAMVNQKDPMAISIAQQMAVQPNPAKFIYDQAKRLIAQQAVGDLSSYEARIRAEERARVLREMQQPAPEQTVPQSLNSLPSAPTSTTPADFEPTPLTSLVGLNF